MEESTGHLVGETSETVSEAMINASADLRKRRSTRIVQAVPLTVSGVDALGRPFTERTSTLVINCHGCRYQSKHYVLKNMWVTLEVPHSEPDKKARTVRGRVAWIQRPRTVRQLFQVALELETAGNVWGIGFPPEDWFVFNDAAEPLPVDSTLAEEALKFNPTSTPESTTPQAAAFHAPSSEGEIPGFASPDNVRIFPSPASVTDASLQLARQMTRLLAESRQQIQAAARDAVTQSLASEQRTRTKDWEQKLLAAREEISREVAGAIGRLREDSEAHSRNAHTSAAEALQKDLPQWIAPQLQDLTRKLTEQLSQEGINQRNETAAHLQSVAETMRNIRQQAEEATAQLKDYAREMELQIAQRAALTVRALEETARQQTEKLDAKRDSMNSTLAETQQHIAHAHSDWQKQIAGELEAAQLRWQIILDNSLASAEERAAEPFNAHLQSQSAQFDQEAERFKSVLQDAVVAAVADAKNRISSAQQGLEEQAARVESAMERAGAASERLANFSTRLETAQQQALGVFQSQVDDLLSLHRNELHRRSESLFEEVATRIRSTFEESTAQAAGHFEERVKELVQPHITKADEAIHRLAGGRSLLDAAMTLQQDRIRTSADEAFTEALGRFRENLGSVEKILQESADAFTANSLSEIEAKTTGMKDRSVADLLQSAEWYEKKAQTQMQAFAKEISEQSRAELVETAGQVSRTFGSEIDHTSRQYLGHAQTQMEDAIRDSFGRARELFGEAAETTTAAFIDEIQRNARQELTGFDAELQNALGETQSKLQETHSTLTRKATAEQEEFLRRFEKRMNETWEAGAAQAMQSAQSQFEPLMQSWRSMIDAYEREVRNNYERIGEQTAEEFRQRLQSVSNQCLLVMAASLDHQSRDAVSGITASAQEKLRETYTGVFTDMGESLRVRLKQIAESFELPPPSSEV